MLLAVAVSFTPPGATAADALDKSSLGVPVGTAMADAAEALDQNGQQQNFDSLKRRRGLIILFSRSLDW